MKKIIAIMFCLLSVNVYSVSCMISVDPLNFGHYDTLSMLPNDVQTNIVVSCDGPEAGNIRLSKGGGSGYRPYREMSNGAYVLNYNIYIDAARTNIWGNGADGTSKEIFSYPDDHAKTAYGRIPAQQAVPEGAYTDTVVVTINY